MIHARPANDRRATVPRAAYQQQQKRPSREPQQVTRENAGPPGPEGAHLQNAVVNEKGPASASNTPDPWPILGLEGINRQ